MANIVCDVVPLLSPLSLSPSLSLLLMYDQPTTKMFFNTEQEEVEKRRSFLVSNSSSSPPSVGDTIL